MLGYFARKVKRARQRFFERPPPPLPAVLALRCREITPSDLEGVTDLLTVGFGRRHREFWVNVVNRLSHHHTPAGFPKYGFMLENDGVPIGVLLQIFTERTIDGVATIWCNEIELLCGSAIPGLWISHGQTIAPLQGRNISQSARLPRFARQSWRCKAISALQRGCTCGPCAVSDTLHGLRLSDGDCIQ